MALELSLKAMVLFVGIGFERRLDHGDEVVGHLFAVDDEAAFEKPVPAMFAIGLGNVKAFDVGWDCVRSRRGIDRCNN